jgi:hypothetical protein
MAPLQLTSSAFASGDPIPEQYGYSARNVNPPLSVDGVPDDAETLALVVDDPDAMEPAGKVWDHWVVWNIDPETTEIAEDSTPTGATQGQNSYGEADYGGPNPPDREHTYRFKLYALDTALALDAGMTKADLEQAMDGHVIDETVLEGTYTP